MRLTFGDMTKEVNVFNLGKHPYDINNQPSEVNFIENVTSEHREETELEARCDIELESENFNLDEMVNSTIKWASSLSSLDQEPISLTHPPIGSSPSIELKNLA